MPPALMVVTGITVRATAPHGIIDRALILHVQEDDLKTDPTGNPGGRAAGAVIR